MRWEDWEDEPDVSELVTLEELFEVLACGITVETSDKEAFGGGHDGWERVGIGVRGERA